ncbi:hypothetical protein Bint_0760 [Brachyspira intermedia PWS/A]|uniref:Uncharacterized protein n=1 Tax=Brachyspira intermedia (strain ATCC 51140 / PWS/A) TaxID=1045858 RepID=G0EKT1_BRAIP|nr:hypothetical protein Bint_0760 [Brachyspira intermedia PWS/A]
MPNNAEMIAGDDKLRVYRYIEKHYINANYIFFLKNSILYKYYSLK